MKIDTGRLQRAIRLEAKPTDTDTYRVTGGAADHAVEIVDGQWVCDCIDAQVRGDGCKHSLLVRLLAGDKEVVEALRELVPPPTGRSTERRTSRPKRCCWDSPNSGGMAPDSRKAGAHVGPGATIADHQGAQSRG